MSYDDRAVVIGGEKERIVAVDPSASGEPGQAAHPAAPTVGLACDTDESTLRTVCHLRVDRAKHLPRRLSQNLMWLIFSRLVVPLLMLAAAAKSAVLV